MAAATCWRGLRHGAQSALRDASAEQAGKHAERRHHLYASARPFGCAAAGLAQW